MSGSLARVDQALRRFTPDPFVLAMVLTAVVLLAGGLRTRSVLEVLELWQGRFWGLLAFGMQMCGVLVTGHAVAMSPPVRRSLERLAAWPQSAPSAAAMVAFTSVGLSFFNWGLCLVGGALLARAVGVSCRERGVTVHYPLLAAAGYAGMMTWHGGLSGSAPLKVTRREDLVELLGPELGGRIEPISTFTTLLSPLNLTVAIGALVWIPLVVALLARGSDPEVFDPRRHGELREAEGDETEWQDHPAVTALLAVPLWAAVLAYLFQSGLGRLDPNAVNLMLLTIGLTLHGSGRRYARAVGRAAAGCGGIILQFPLYAGIMGIMTGTGLAADLARGASSSGGRPVFLLLTFLSAGLGNLFVPSGGGQWAVQGPIALEAASALNVSPGSVVLAVAYGDQWTNMLQPFWALPLLGITGVRAGAILGTTIVLLMLGALWFGLCLVALG